MADLIARWEDEGGAVATELTEKDLVDDRVYTLDDVYNRKIAEDKTALYIAGPMTNHPQFNYGAFDALEAALEAMGYVVASPARLDDTETRRAALRSDDGSPGSGSCNGETWGDFLARDMKCIADIVDGVLLMPGWETSKGAKLEAFVCRHVDKPVFYSCIYTNQHEDTCMCEDIGCGTDISLYPLVQLDDAELDRVLAITDGRLLEQIQQDELAEELEVNRIKTRTTKLPEEALFMASLPPLPPDETDLPSDGKATNPKDAIGSGKMPMHLWPKTATAMGALGLLDGMLKYGRSNWRAAGVRASIYYDAVDRHLTAWFEGEDHDPDSGLPHMAHALACLAIIVDAEAAGMLNDDRQFNGGAWRRFLTEASENIDRLKDNHADKDPRHYTINDNEENT